MNFTSQICTTKEQSEQLLALGLKKETADMTYLNDKICTASYNEMECPYDNLVNPAWSLHRLIEMLPKKMSHQSKQWHLFLSLCYEDAISYEECNSLQPCYLHFCNLENIYDNIIEAIEWLIKNGCFNKEYLDE